MIREAPIYRRAVFMQGLKAAGYDVRAGTPADGAKPDDVLVIWNRYYDTDVLATRFERQGGRVVVAENGYVGYGGSAPKFDVLAGPQPGHYYALALGGHNGRGTWPSGDGSRFAALGVWPQPWNEWGGHVLVCPNRSFGQPGMIMPDDWDAQIVKRLAKLTDRPVRVRKHPGNDKPARPLEKDLEGCGVMVIWSSSAGVHALLHGIPVICMAPYWVCRSAASWLLSDVEEHLFMNTVARQQALERMAWAQWTAEEIRTGEPFRRLLHA